LHAAGDSQPEGVHSLVSVVDIQLVLQHLFPLKSEADVSAAIKAVSSANQITISALMPIHRYGLITEEGSPHISKCLNAFPNGTCHVLPNHLGYWTFCLISLPTGHLVDFLYIIHGGCVELDMLV